MPFGNREQMEDVFISLESNRNGDKINTPVNPGLSKKKGGGFSKSSRSHCLHRIHEHHNTTCPESQGDLVYLIFSYMGF